MENRLNKKVEELRKKERKAERKKRDKNIDDFFDGLKAKNDILQYDFDEKTKFNQKQELNIIVNDKKGNTTTWKSDVIFKK